MKLKYFIKNLIIVIAFITIAYNICEAAPYYIDNNEYGEKIRLIIDDVEKTRELPDDIYVIENEILISLDTAQKFIDSRINFTNDSVRANYDKYILRMPIGDNKITINKDEMILGTSVQEISGDIYLPIKPFEEIYGIKADYNEKVIVTTKAAETFSKGVLAKNTKLKKYKREKCLTVRNMKKGEIIEIATPDFENVDSNDYVYVRNEQGDLGYVKKSKLKLVEIENEIVINGKDESRRIPDEVRVENDMVLLSIDTIKKHFDEYIYFDEKYDTVIACGNDKLAKLKLNSDNISINGEVSAIKTSAKLIGEKVYVPIEEFADLYSLKISKDEIITIEKLQENEDAQKRNGKISLVWEYATNATPNRDGEEKIDAINIVSPTWIYVKNSNGEVKHSINENYIKWATSNDYEVWPTIKNDDIGIENTSILVTDMKNREEFIKNIVGLCEKYNFKGINLDFEHMYQRDRDEYVMLVRQLDCELGRRGIITTVDVNVPDGSSEWSLCFNSKAISDSCDYIMVMAYDQYGQSSKKEGPVASIEWVNLNLDKMINRDKIDNEKLVLGVPFYSRYWVLKNNEVSSTKAYSMAVAKDVMNNKKGSATWDDSLGQYVVEYTENGKQIKLYVEDENSLREKLKLIDKYNLAGVAAWRRGQETKSVWKVIEEELD